MKDQDNKIYKNFEFLARQLVEGFITGHHKSPYHGFSVEFAEHNPYNTGESTRHIDWKVFARTDKLYTKRYEEETNLRCRLLIDHSASMHYPEPGKEKLQYSLLAAAALSYLMQKQRDAVSVGFFSDKLDVQTECKSTEKHLSNIYALLENELKKDPPQSITKLSEVLHSTAGTIHKRSLVILFTDFISDFDQMEQVSVALQHLKHKKHEVVIFHVYDGETELDLNLDDRPYLFVDKETGEKLKLNPVEIKEAYHEAQIKEFTKIENRCRELKMDFIPVDIRKDLKSVLLTYLNKRKRMR
ncbi:DUF58 domain-containing protein [Marinigracilibium pacificum]|uniref:DUF58 domain-containing protein n=1 Tax=Marinigracilibium pacificum TaxID=2729599 RepID=A0A848J1H4_9BACT|nr:DUF58 domain-containing protein [Marinigracilibium pacificum]NMM49198.1 DUF58 domain-containing protein [Marinigracilibium pacificum]